LPEVKMEKAKGEREKAKGMVNVLKKEISERVNG
jgi:hypothetical protein